MHHKSFILSFQLTVHDKASTRHGFNSLSEVLLLQVWEGNLCIVDDLLELIEGDLETSLLHEGIDMVDSILRDPEDTFHASSLRLIPHKGFHSYSYNTQLPCLVSVEEVTESFGRHEEFVH
jgi:hypothetical protein